VKVRIALLSILMLAAALRFAGLGWGLRHVPHWDERVFVENVWQMHTSGDLDHRYYEYPGLFPLMLYPFIGAVHREGPATPEAYLVARSVVALLGVLNVALVYVLGVRYSCWRLGLAAALLLAVSPIDLNTSHMVRPDVALQSAILLGFLVFRRLGEAVAGDLKAGLVLGAAGAIKFTGAFLVPSYLAARWLAPGPRLGRVALAGGVAAFVLVAATPYAIINYPDFVRGLQVQFGAHYNNQAFAPFFLGYLGYYLGKIVFTLGPFGALLAAIGVVLGRGQWRQWLPPLLYVVTTLVVMSTAELRFPRHLVPASGALCLFAALPLARLGLRRPWLALGAAALTAAWPLGSSLVEVKAWVRPSTPDRALDWIDSRAADDAVILNGFHGFQKLGIDRRRYDVLDATGSPQRDRRLAEEADFVIAGRSDAAFVADWALSHVVEPESEFSGPPIVLFEVRPGSRRRYTTLRLEPGWLGTSDNPAALPKLLDGRPRTQWHTSGPQRAGDWIEVSLPSPTPVARIEMEMGPWDKRFARSLELLSRTNAEPWQARTAIDGRPSATELARWGRPVSQVLLLEPVPVTAIRIVAGQAAERKWGVSELRILVPRQQPAPPEG